MTMKTAIPAGGEAAPANRPINDDDLLNAITDALRMASIASDLISQVLAGAPHAIDGKLKIFRIAPDRVDNTIFAVFKTEEALKDLLAKWEVISSWK